MLLLRKESDGFIAIVVGVAIVTSVLLLPVTLNKCVTGVTNVK